MGHSPSSDQFLVIFQAPELVFHPCPMEEYLSSVSCCGRHCRGFDVLVYLSVSISGLCALRDSALSLLHLSTQWSIWHIAGVQHVHLMH